MLRYFNINNTDSKKEKQNDAYVYVDRLLSYVDNTPYFSSLYLNMSFGSHPFDWL